jgi:Zn-dependent protease
MSATPETAPLPSPSEPPEAAPPVAVLDPAERDYLAARTAFLAPERSASGGLLLLGTMALFVLVARQGDRTWMDVVLLVGVLLFHELGHWLGMRLFGFQDVKMFFIPFFGAAVSGRNVGAQAWKEALVLLMGPLPGLVLGTALLVGNAVVPSPLVASAAQILLFINAFNLLPIAPLDGGRLFQLLLFSRNRHLETGFTVFAGLVMLGLGLGLGEWALGILAGLMLLGVPRQAKVLGIADTLRASTPGVEREPAALEEPAMRSLYSASAPLIPEGTAAEVRLTPHVRAMREVHLRARMRAPSALVSLGFLVLWGVGWVIALVGLVLWGFSGAVPPPG